MPLQSEMNEITDDDLRELQNIVDMFNQQKGKLSAYTILYNNRYPHIGIVSSSFVRLYCG